MSARTSCDRERRLGFDRAVLTRLVVILPLAGMMTACGPLPRPFEQERVSDLLQDQRALAPLLVEQIDGAPGLAEAISAALNREEIAATTTTAGDGFQVLSGSIRNDGGTVRLLWQITEDNGHVIETGSQPLQQNSLEPGLRPLFAAQTARTIAHNLRGDDSGVADIEAEPHVALRALKTPKDFDGNSLSRAMTRALAQQGMVVVFDRPAFIIDGNLTIGPTVSGQNQVTVDWTVRDKSGRDLGTVSQGSPVPHERLVGPLTGLARDIATAGAEGIRDVIRGQTGR